MVSSKGKFDSQTFTFLEARFAVTEHSTRIHADSDVVPIQEGSALLPRLYSLVASLLGESPDPARSLVEQGLDSLGAEELVDTLRQWGYRIDYSMLIDGSCLEALASAASPCNDREAGVANPEPADVPIPLAASQLVWLRLHRLGWGAWANISLSVSVPASLVTAAYLPALIQQLCESNDAMRMVLVHGAQADDSVCQRVLADFQAPVEMREAPLNEGEIKRLIESFEQRYISPFQPTTRALVLFAGDIGDRHYLTVTMHHAFADREAMHVLRRQLRQLLGDTTSDPPGQAGMSFEDYVRGRPTPAGSADTVVTAALDLRGLLANANVSSRRPLPRLGHETGLDLGDLPLQSKLDSAQATRLFALARHLGTTLPLFLHAVFSVLLTRLIGDASAVDGESDILLCHVVSNRRGGAALRNLVGCLDTSVPVAARLAQTDTLFTFCGKTRQAFSRALEPASLIVRGDFINPDSQDSADAACASLFERIPHINVVRTPTDEVASPGDIDLRTQPVNRVQKTRWGVLLRVTLPPGSQTVNTGRQEVHEPGRGGIGLSLFAEHRPLAVALNYCLAELLNVLQVGHVEKVAQYNLLECVDKTVAKAAFASQQRSIVAATMSPGDNRDAFIYTRLIERQQRWFRHDATREVCRDEYNRFIPSSGNPLTFGQLDKLAERRFLEEHGVPMPRLLGVLTKENLSEQLRQLVPTLAGDFVIKPVGAGHSFGVTVVRGGIDCTRGGIAFDADTTAEVLSAMAERGFCEHEGQVFRFNFSSFLVEQLVLDDTGHPSPVDYKLFMIGGELLWAQVHFEQDGLKWVGFVDSDFQLMPQPAWDPEVCWRTHRVLICSEAEIIRVRRPGCWSDIVDRSRQLGAELGIFVRFDWYADRHVGPLMGEITTFPHMLQPRSFYSSWANNRVREAWRGPDGTATDRIEARAEVENGLSKRIENLLGRTEPGPVELLDFLPEEADTVWAVNEGIDYATLRRRISSFDLSAWGIPRGERVGIQVSNGAQLGELLLCVINRYCAVPLDPDYPAAGMRALVLERKLTALLVVAGSVEAQRARQAGLDRDLVLIELDSRASTARASLAATSGKHPGIPPPMQAQEEVLLLHTSGTTGEPKAVTYTLSMLIRAGGGLARSMDLSPRDTGISMLPLHHVGGLLCNLVAPLLVSSRLSFHSTFDPRSFFQALEGQAGASWCYLVPTMWQLVLDYAAGHPELQQTRPWPNLRLIRSAGANLDHGIALALAEMFGEGVSVLPTYGMTEAMPIASPPPGYRLQCPGSVGKVLPGIKVEIVDPSPEQGLVRVADGTVGEITLRGDSVAPDYDHSGGAEAELFTPRGYLRTGDMGRLARDGSGWLFVCGRLKNAINRGGETIAPGEVEQVLKNYPGWCMDHGAPSPMVFARRHELLGEDVALAVARGQSDTRIENLNEWALQHLPSSMLPATLVFVAVVPGSGDKSARMELANRLLELLPPATPGLRQTYRLNHDNELTLLTQSGSDPTDLAEVRPVLTLDRLLEELQEFVGTSPVLTPDTCLTDAGLNSLAAVELAERLNQRFHLQLPTWVVSDHPTPRQLLKQMLEDLAGRGLRGFEPAVSAATSSSEVQRILMLHGEGADAGLMNLGMQASHWTHGFAGTLEFLYMDAPHACEPKPEFHEVAVEAGIYNKKGYWSWGVTDERKLNQSLAVVEAALDDLSPIHGIGGICDGGLVAALVASRRRDLKLYLNFSSSPVSRLHPVVRHTDWTVTCPSLHLVSPVDQMLCISELLEISGHCANARIIQHDRGHAVPLFDRQVQQALQGLLDGYVASPVKVIDGAPELLEPEAEVETETEAKLREIWQQLLGPVLISPQANFFELGGDSNKAVQLFAQLERIFGYHEPLSILVDKPSLRLLARHIESLSKTTCSRVMLPLKKDGNKEPLFLVHAERGGILFYRQLAMSIDPLRPVYAIQSLFLVDDRIAPTTMEELAAIHVKEIKAVQPSGPYHLLGRCFGGVLMLEIANQLIEDGESVGLLCVIDSAPPLMQSPGQAVTDVDEGGGDVKQRRPLDYMRLVVRHWRQHTLLNVVATFIRFDILARLARNVSACAYPLLFLSPTRLPAMMVRKLVGQIRYRTWRTAYLNRRLKGSYRAHEYPDHIVLVRSGVFLRKASKAKHENWRKICGGRLTTHVVEGSHDSIFLEPQVRQLAAIIRRELD